MNSTQRRNHDILSTTERRIVDFLSTNLYIGTVSVIVWYLSTLFEPDNSRARLVLGMIHTCECLSAIVQYTTTPSSNEDKLAFKVYIFIKLVCILFVVYPYGTPFMYIFSLIHIIPYTLVPKLWSILVHVPTRSPQTD